MAKIMLSLLKTKPVITCIISAIVVLWASELHAGKALYKWEDENGVPHYTETPPLGRPYEKVKVQGSSAGKNPNSPQSAQVPTSSSVANGGKDKDPSAGAIVPVDPERCRIARERLKVLSNRARIRQVQDDGSYKFLTPEEIQSNIEQAQKAIQESCDS